MQGRSTRRSRRFLPLSAEHTFILFAVLLAVLFLMGGGSRSDIQSLAALRPFALLAAAVGVLALDRETLRTYRAPFLLLVALALLMVVQLIPLPWSSWTSLPWRGTIAQLDEAVGLAGNSRPITISPMRTANSLASLAVPFAVLVLYCQLSELRRRQVLVALVGIGVAGAVLGFFQIFSGGSGGLYFYAVTHRGDAVGFFANRNHHAAFLAIAMLIAVHLAMERRGPDAKMTRILAFAAAAVLLVGIVTNVSRGGLLAGAVALVFVPLVISGSPGEGRPARSRWITVGSLALPVIGIFALFALSQRSPALSRLLTDGTSEEIRFQIMPVLLQMARDYQPWGAGFGAFEQAYRMAEPTELLVRNYFNHAHNDWLQLAIEGGVAAVLIAAAMIVVIAIRAFRMVGSGLRDDPRTSRAWLAFAVLAVLAVASVLDYPLRVPALMGVAFIALTELFAPAFPSKSQE